MNASCDIDSPEQFGSLDKEGMMELVLNLPGQMAHALESGRTLNLPHLSAAQILHLGMGGSAMAGHLLRAHLRDELAIPYEINQSYDIPAWAGSRTLAIAVSYSGETEETLTALDKAARKGCQVICVASGGSLRQRALAMGAPFIEVPSGYPPRAALGHLHGALLAALEKTGIAPPHDKEITETIALLESLREEWHPRVPLEKNEAKRLATRIAGKVPIVFGSSDASAAVAYRWKTQFNENGKSLCYTERFPELNHNEIVGWAHSFIPQKAFHVCFLRDSGEPEPIKTRIDFTEEIISGKTTTDHLWSRGTSALAKLMSLVFLGDLASTYLALLYGTNPTSIDVITEMKKRLSTLSKGKK
ncbi:MAG: bifunctional phosphoglucose/phosphomannose isomerase [Candidatus Eremiobacteraeota bacterium]|nr:bifunctional phosphoglucose/phosphomannose isomerase [Candidatus Eremiobacteraeota bacterium]